MSCTKAEKTPELNTLAMKTVKRCPAQLTPRMMNSCFFFCCCFLCVLLLFFFQMTYMFEFYFLSVHVASPYVLGFLQAKLLSIQTFEKSL